MDVCRLFVLCGGEVSAVSAFVLPFLCGLGAAVISAWGVGGGTLLLLVMTLFLGVDQRTAQGINLLFFLPTALSALLCHRKNGCLDTPTLRARRSYRGPGGPAGSVDCHGGGCGNFAATLRCLPAALRHFPASAAKKCKKVRRLMNSAAGFFCIGSVCRCGAV